MTTTANPATGHLDRYQSLITQLPGSDLAWLRRRREDALAQCREQGFPSLKQEDWRYTNVRSIVDDLFEPAMGPVQAMHGDDIKHLMPGRTDEPCLVLVNGYLHEGLSRRQGLPSTVIMDGMQRILESRPEQSRSLVGSDPGDRHAFHALNTAAAADGAWIHVAADTLLGRPLHILHIALELDGPISALPLNRIRLEAGAHATVNEYFHSTGESRYLSNARTLIHIGEGARLNHHRIQRESPAAFHISTVNVELEKNAEYHNHNLSLGGRIGRTEIDLRYLGEGGRSRINGLFLAHDDQLQDFHTRVEHGQPACSTQQAFKGILSGKGRGVFDGCIKVHPEAQQTDAHMRNDNLLLSRNAEVDTKPQLQINANDVKCSHGATVGELDATALFYLRSRGIPEARARQMLTRGFALELLTAVDDQAMRAYMEQALVERLEQTHV